MNKLKIFRFQLFILLHYQSLTVCFSFRAQNQTYSLNISQKVIIMMRTISKTYKNGTPLPDFPQQEANGSSCWTRMDGHPAVTVWSNTNTVITLTSYRQEHVIRRYHSTAVLWRQEAKGQAVFLNEAL